MASVTFVWVDMGFMFTSPQGYYFAKFICAREYSAQA